MNRPDLLLQMILFAGDPVEAVPGCPVEFCFY